MLPLIKELYFLLTPRQRMRFHFLSLLVVLQSIVEIMAVAAIGPFMALVADISILERDNKLATIYSELSPMHASEFVVWAGIIVLSVLAFSTFLSAVVDWKLIRFGNGIGVEIANRLYKYYLYQDWIFHLGSSSAVLTKQISTEAVRMAREVVAPLLMIFARVVFATLMSIGVFLLNPIVAICGLTIFSLAYLLLYKVIRVRTNFNGQRISQLMTNRFRLMHDAFGGIRDLLLLGRQSYFIRKFYENGSELIKRQSNNQTLQQIPGRFIELVCFASVILLILYLLSAYDGNPNAILPTLSVYAMAGFKLLPAFQSIYRSMAQIRGAISAFEAIREDLTESIRRESSATSPDSTISGKIAQAASSIDVIDLSFAYPGSDRPVLQNVNLKIDAGSVVGIVGPTGSGKSTMADLMLGLIRPQQGEIRIDGHQVEGGAVLAWQRSMGSIPQSIFLANASIEENIAFGIPSGEIDDERVRQSVEMACLTDVVSRLPLGIKTNIGDRGIKLSGGQRQRIGIARAIYQDTGVLIFDEATSALDGITERQVMDAITKLSRRKTIVMIAHRLSTIKECDQVVLLDQGRIIDSGTYDELYQRNEMFREMASSSNTNGSVLVHNTCE